MDAGREFPPWDNRPQLSPRLAWVWQAFQELQTCRPQGMGVGPIPWNAIHEYAVAKGVADTERFERLIRAMDSAWLDHYHERRDEEREGG